MKRQLTIRAGFFVFAVLCCQCKQKYVSPYVQPNVGYLVVEGFISGNRPIQYTLSRTLPLPGDSAIPMETGASVEVEGSDNSSISLIEQGSGVYSSVDTPMLNTLIRYRLRIHTTEGEDYLSDFVPFRPSPPIDSINWIEGPSGVTIYANTHDPANATHYYQWNFDETWEFHSAENSEYEYDTATGKVIPRPASSEIWTCWHEGPSTNVLLGSSIKLAQDVIYEQPLELLPKNGVQLSILYTTLVRQYALTDSGYTYFSILQKNTESLGTIFDAQPSALFGNIHSLTKPTEQVLGFISAGTIQQQRIWISPAQVPGWDYVPACPSPDINVGLDSLSEIYPFTMGGYIPIDPHLDPPPGPPGVNGWSSNVVGCIDCRAEGGVLYKPSYWPND
jgi:Domain of unknown function (DUF4249)